jgi:hypothetical protein
MANLKSSWYGDWGEVVCVKWLAFCKQLGQLTVNIYFPVLHLQVLESRTARFRNNKTDNIEVRSCNHCYHRLAKRCTYSECESVSFVIQYVKCLRSIVLSSVVCLALLCSSILSHNVTISEKKKFSTTFVRNISHSMKNSARYHKCTCHQTKVPVTLVRY